MTSNVEYSVKLYLIIKGCDFDHLAEIVNVKPTKQYAAGDYMSACLPPVSENLWVFAKKYDDGSFSDYMVEDIIKACRLNADIVESINKVGRCFLRIAIQSDYAQIGINMSSNIMKSLSSIGLDMEMSILSWGGVKNDD